MKRFLMVLVVLSGTALCFAQNAVFLDKGLEDAAAYLSTHIAIGKTTTVLNVTADTEDLSKYVVTELSNNMAKNGMIVYDRNNLDATQREIEFGWTEAVNSNTAQSYGEAVGAEIVIIGTFTASNNNTYRLQIQAIEVESKRIQPGTSIMIKQDAHLLALLHKTTQKEYSFTNEQKGSAGFQNMAFGLGSFRMGDPLGGATVLGAEVVSLGLIITGAVFLSAADEASYSDYYNFGGKIHEDYGTELAGQGTAFLVSGGITFALAVTWGFVRPYLYDKPVEKIATVIDRVHIGVVPRVDGALAVGVSYRQNFWESIRPHCGRITSKRNMYFGENYEEDCFCSCNVRFG